MEDSRIPNKDIISELKEVLAAMEVKEYNKFRVSAYRNVISILENLTVSIYDLWETKRLNQIPGVGGTIINHLNELFKTGKVHEWEQVKKDLPEGMFNLISLRSVGAKKAYKLAEKFKINKRENAIEELKKHAQKGEIQGMEGFGEKSEKLILEAIEQSYLTKSSKERILYTRAERVVERIVSYMKELDCVVDIEATGSFRRKNATIGDLDIPVATTDPEKTLDHFSKFNEIQKVLVMGKKRTSVLLTNDLQVDLYVCDPEEYGSMLQYFTGSKQHNILLRSYALTKGLSLSEYGIKSKEKTEKFSNEEAFYKKLNLPLIPPEIREGSDEVELARKNKLPKLIELKDIKGDLHFHTDLSDGLNTLEEMIEKAINLGYEYIGVADHAPSIRSRGYGTVLRIVTDMRKKIEQLDKTYPSIKILYGYEINILVDATLGLPDEIMKMLDFAVAGIHTSFNQSSKEITARLISALENPYVDIISHPSGRLINERDPEDPNWDKIFQVAKDNKKILEINAQPNRLDLPSDLVRSAIEWGVDLVVSSDAHSVEQLDYMKYGIDNARRGWAEKKNIINTLPYSEFVNRLRLR